MTYIPDTFAKDIEDIVTGAPVGADRELLPYVLAYFRDIQSWKEELGTQYHIRFARAEQKLKDAYFWIDAIQNNLDLLNFEVERAHLQLLERADGFRRKSMRCLDIPARDLDIVTPQEYLAHERLRTKIDKGTVWKTKSLSE